MILQYVQKLERAIEEAKQAFNKVKYYNNHREVKIDTVPVEAHLIELTNAMNTMKASPEYTEVYDEIYNPNKKEAAIPWDKKGPWEKRTIKLENQQ